MQTRPRRVPWPYPNDGALTYYRDYALPAMARGDEWHCWIGRPWQRQVLMTEASEAVTDYWIDALGFPVMRIP